MSLETILKTSAGHVLSGLSLSEAQVKLSVIVPILRGLGWNDTNPAEFVPEFSIDNGQVDYALCEANNQPLVFVEAKRLGKANSEGEEQLFGYANNKGVPLLVLTDGDVWNFYLSMVVGEPAERRFYRMELRREEKIPDYAKFLNDHLQKNAVLSGNAKRRAEDLHESGRARKASRDAIPRVWQDLLKSGDETLRDLLVESVESDCGVRPELDDVVDFLSRQTLPTGHSQVAQGASTFTGSVKSRHRAPASPRKKIKGYVLYGKDVDVGKGNRTLAAVLKVFQSRDPKFIERFAANPKTVGRTRRLVAQSREDLYDQRDLVEYSVELKDGWWLGTNLDTVSVRRHIETACEIAGVKFGSQLRLIEH
ncbi:MAG: hypothetical protein OXU29_00505 [Gammaproteobacteria bacterium]|nr:hypothetical protein [Gammaproteobacteria bacterium]